jgi:thiol-disulfide isomerase/thioredoxin
MPALLEFAEKYKDKGVEVITICTKLGKKVKKCWEGVKELKMDSLQYNLGDYKNLSGFHANFNIRATPTVFILDKDKKILIKQIPTEKLGEILDQIIEDNKSK